MGSRRIWVAGGALVALAAVVGGGVQYSRTERARLAVEQGMGPAPELPAPAPRLLPTVNIANPIGWGKGEHPTPAPGLDVAAFASGWIIRVGSMSCPMGMYWSPRATLRERIYKHSRTVLPVLLWGLLARGNLAQQDYAPA